MDYQPNTSLHLTLLPENDDDQPKLGLYLDPSFSSSSSSSSSPSSYSSMSSTFSTPEPHIFSCNFCPRMFYSSQAPGGPQNAHKLERILTKKSRSELSSSAANKLKAQRPSVDPMATGGGSSSHLHMDMDMERFRHHQPRRMASHSAGTGKFEAADIKSFGKPSAGRLDNMEYGCVRGASASWTNNEYGSYSRARHKSSNGKDEFSNHLDLSLRL